METADLPTIVRDYLKKRFPDLVGVAAGDWIYVWETGASKSLGIGPVYIAQVMETSVTVGYVIGYDSNIEAADPKFFERLEKLVKSYLKEQNTWAIR